MTDVKTKAPETGPKKTANASSETPKGATAAPAKGSNDGASPAKASPIKSDTPSQALSKPAAGGAKAPTAKAEQVKAEQGKAEQVKAAPAKAAPLAASKPEPVKAQAVASERAAPSVAIAPAKIALAETGTKIDPKAEAKSAPQASPAVTMDKAQKPVGETSHVRLVAATEPAAQAPAARASVAAREVAATGEFEPEPFALNAVLAPQPDALVAPVLAFVEAGSDSARAAYVRAQESGESFRRAYVESASAVSRGLVAINSQVLDLMRAQSNVTLDFWRSSLAVGSLSDAVKLQTSGARQAFETATTHLRSIAETTTRVVGETSKPVQSAFLERGR